MFNVRSEYETIYNILDRGASLGRFGDGELRICIGGRTKPQPYNPELKERLIQILNSSHFDFLVGVPRVLGREDDYPAKEHWDKFFKKSRIKDLLNPSKEYFSSFISRKESAPDLKKKSYWDLVGSLWAGRHIVIVEGDHFQFSDACKTTNEFYHTCSVHQVIAPKVNAFKYHEGLLKEICDFPKDYLIVISLGAAATVLAYDLYEKGYQALDVGRLALHHARVMEEWKNN